MANDQSENWRSLQALIGGAAERPITVAHLGQSLDGFIATTRGDSRYVTGPENLEYIHRMRASFDAVIVGRETVACDDPQLTTRLVPGKNPVRVVLDPACRLARGHRIFTDGQAPTLVVCGESAVHRTPPGAEPVAVAELDGRLQPTTVVAALHARGLRRLFVEGGGITVSRFLAAGALDRLQITVAPILIGEGRRGAALPAAEPLSAAWRQPARRFEMGADTLFDFDLSGP